MATLFNRTRVLSPNQTTIMYWNSMFDFSMYKAHAAMEELEAQGTPVYLRDKFGTVIQLWYASCPPPASVSVAQGRSRGLLVVALGGKPPLCGLFAFQADLARGAVSSNDGDVYCNITTFDWTQPAARQVWVEAITNMTATGLVDGIYADHSAEKGVGIGSNFGFTKKGNGPNQLCNGNGAGRRCFNFTEEFSASFNSWHYWGTNYTQDLLSKTTGGPVIAGPLANMSVRCTFDGIRDMQNNGPLTMIEARCGCQPKPSVLIQYLAAAERFTYAHCLTSPDEKDGGKTLIDETTFPEMDYDLGEPMGPAVEVPSSGSNVWHRKFASGAWVTWDNNQKNGSYFFPGKPPYPPSGPTPPPPAPPLPAVCGSLLKDTGMGGAEITRMKTGSYGECCSKCQDNRECVIWAWHGESGGKCHLHTKGADQHKVKGCYAGIMDRRLAGYRAEDQEAPQ